MKYDQGYTNYQLDRSYARILIRKIYLYNILRYIKGKTIDFGCGIGEQLQVLPAGSIGYEINEYSAEYCRKNGLDVRLLSPGSDSFKDINCKAGEFRTLLMSHIVEHLENPPYFLNQIFTVCNKIEIERIIVVVPCTKGYKFDKTHITFVDINYIMEYNLTSIDNYRLVKWKYFPIIFKRIGDLFTYNELILIYDINNIQKK